jgi:hypothetical protein
MDRDEALLSRSTDEHLLPRGKGGSNAASNRVRACIFCNGLRGDMDHDEFEVAARVIEPLRGDPNAIVDGLRHVDPRLAWIAYGMFLGVVDVVPRRHAMDEVPAEFGHSDLNPWPVQEADAARWFNACTDVRRRIQAVSRTNPQSVVLQVGPGIDAFGCLPMRGVIDGDGVFLVDARERKRLVRQSAMSSEPDPFLQRDEACSWILFVVDGMRVATFSHETCRAPYDERVRSIWVYAEDPAAPEALMRAASEGGLLDVEPHRPRELAATG